MNIFIVDNSAEINMNLLRMSKTPLPQLIMAMQRGLTLTLKEGGMNVAVCVLEKRDGVYELIHLAVDPDYQNQGFGKELLLHSMDYVRFLGGKTLETGAGNADVQSFTFLQRHGFRVTGVLPDHYIFGHALPEVENSIVNRDMLRYTADLQAMTAQ